MTFLEALEEAKKGKKVRRHAWLPEIYLVIENGKIKMCNAQFNNLYKDDYTSISWEIYEEKILTNEEKEYIRNTIKFCWCPVEEITLLDKKRSVVLRFSSSCGDVDLSFYFKKDYFKNMEPNRPYTLKELGLDD